MHTIFFGVRHLFWRAQLLVYTTFFWCAPLILACTTSGVHHFFLVCATYSGVHNFWCTPLFFGVRHLFWRAQLLVYTTFFGVRHH